MSKTTCSSTYHGVRCAEAPGHPEDEGHRNADAGTAWMSSVSDEARTAKAMETPLVSLEFSVRTSNSLELAGLKTVRDLYSLDASAPAPGKRPGLWSVRNLGARNVKEICELLAQMGLSPLRHGYQPNARKAAAGLPAYRKPQSRSDPIHLPAGRHRAGSDLVVEQLPPVANDRPAVWPLVVEDMQARDAEGRRKYGVPLQPANGRDPAVDAYQESLDQTVYLRQLIEERNEACGWAFDLGRQLQEGEDRSEQLAEALEQVCCDISAAPSRPGGTFEGDMQATLRMVRRVLEEVPAGSSGKIASATAGAGR